MHIINNKLSHRLQFMVGEREIKISKYQFWHYSWDRENLPSEIFMITTGQGLIRITYGPLCGKTYLQGCANNKGADQPAHPRSLISAFVIRLLKSIIFRPALS